MCASSGSTSLTPTHGECSFTPNVDTDRWWTRQAHLQWTPIGRYPRHDRAWVVLISSPFPMAKVVVFLSSLSYMRGTNCVHHCNNVHVNSCVYNYAQYTTYITQVFLCILQDPQHAILTYVVMSPSFCLSCCHLFIIAVHYQYFNVWR